jgi:hypothetical protein
MDEASGLFRSGRAHTRSRSIRVLSEYYDRIDQLSSSEETWRRRVYDLTGAGGIATFRLADRRRASRHWQNRFHALGG